MIVYKATLKAHSSDQHGNSGGSMVAKFNPDGTLLAFHRQMKAKNEHEICVLQLTNLKVTLNLSGHRNFVYDLDWLNDTILVSISSDCTAILWFLQEKSYSMRVMLRSSPKPDRILLRPMPTNLKRKFCV